MTLHRNKAIVIGALGVAALVIGGAYWIATASGPAQGDSVLQTEHQQRSYALGMSQANGFRRNAFEVDVELFSRGLKDALVGEKTLLTEEQSRTIVANLQAELKQKQLARQKDEARARGEKNTSEGQTFLAANKESEGVITLDSGLQYKILKNGNGKKPTIDDVVVVNYRGTTIDGTEFDSSAKRGPTDLPVNKLITGWSEALQLMPVGSKWQLVVPPHLAYGQRPMGRVIGPNATLVFEVELLGIKERTAQGDKREALASSKKPQRSAVASTSAAAGSSALSTPK